MSPLKERIYFLSGTLFLCVAIGILCWVAAADLCPVAAVTAPPEPVLSEEEPAPPEIAPERGPSPRNEDPFRGSDSSDTYEEARQKREKRTIIIILVVVVLLCAYWLISGRLRQRLPPLK